MKKMKKRICVLAAALALGGCATTKPGDGVSLEEAIEQSAADVAAKLPTGSRVAIVAFDAEHENISNYIMDELTGAFVDGSLEVADRRNLAFVYKELNFQISGDVSDETAVSIGKFLGAKYVIIGQLIKAGSRYRYRVSGINVETAVQESSTRLNVYDNRNLKSLLTDLRKNAGVTVAAAYDKRPQTASNTAGTLLDRGILFASRGDFEMAIADFTEAIKLDGKSAAAYYNRGNTYIDKEDYDRAIADLNQALRLDPSFVRAYNELGFAYAHKGEYDRAMANYNQAIKLNPNYVVAYSNRGCMYIDKGDYDRAIADFNQAIRLDPNYAMAYHNRGIAYRQKGDYDRAIADYSQVIRLDPNNAAAYHNRGVAYIIKGNFDRAIADFQAALKINPNDENTKQWLEGAQKRGR
jgi:tetratricopeptide (TPR) repeat protein